MSNPFIKYYMQQAGGGVPDFHSGAYRQRGYGIGNIFSSLFRSVIPLFRKYSPVVGKELLKTGANVLTDISQGVKPLDSLKSRAYEGGKELYRNIQSGTGKHKMKRLQNFRHSVLVPRASKTKKLCRTKTDIFS